MHIRKEPPNFEHLKSIKNEAKAILWDMDGTIMKTEALHARAIHEILRSQSQSFVPSPSQIEKECWGETDHIVYQKYKNQKLIKDLSFTEFIETKNQKISINLEQIHEKEIFNSNVRDYINELNKQGIKQAIVTSSEKTITHKLLTFLNLKDCFEFIITREDTQENKPNPAPYLLALDKLSLSAQDVVIYEDSIVGLEAAEKSKATVCKAQWYIE